MATNNPRAEKIKKQMDARLSMYTNKNEMYGDSFTKTFKEYGPISALTRMEDKMNRIKNLIFNSDLPSSEESLIDTLNDLANYCDMTIVALGDTIEKAEAKPKKERKKRSKKADSTKESKKEPKKREKKAKKEKKDQTPVEPKSPLEEMTRDQLVSIAKSLDISVSNKTSKLVIISMIEKRFSTPDEIEAYLKQFTTEAE